MKSKRAEDYIQYHRHKGPYTEGDFDAWRIYEAVELAEEEMVEKAGRVFAEYCEMHLGGGKCLVGGECTTCTRIIEFKLKLKLME